MEYIYFIVKQNRIIRVPMNWVGKRVKISFKNKSLSKEMKELIRNANNNHNG